MFSLVGGQSLEIVAGLDGVDEAVDVLVEWKDRALAFFVQRLRLNAKVGRWGSEGAAQDLC